MLSSKRAAKRSSSERLPSYRPSHGMSKQARTPSAMGYRPSAISNIRPTSSISITSIQAPRRAACSPTSEQLGPSIRTFSPFNSLNSFILKGDGAQGMELTFASLMARAEDEPDALYGLAARAVQISPDGLTYRFLLRPGIKFHDGSPITAHDVAFSLKILKDKGHPIAQQLLRDFVGAEAPDDATVVLSFAPKRARDVPLFTASLPIFSREYYSKH